MKILVTGCGSIGRRHMKNLLAFPGIHVVAHDMAVEGRNKVQEQFGIHAFERFDDALLEEPEAVVIATPTSAHAVPALAAARAGCHLFIEKPVASNIQELTEVLSIVREKALVTLVGCNMRFHPGLKQVKRLLEDGQPGKVLSALIETGSYMPEWRAGVDYRQVYSSRKVLGGGVILDAIHEIDYARWMLGEVNTVSCMAGKRSALEIDVEDVADILLGFTSGVVAHLHLDYVQRSYARNCKIIGENGVIIWDINAGQVGIFTADTKQWRWLKQPDQYDLNQMYIDELGHFLNCVKGIEKPTLDIFGGVEDLRIALAAKQSAEENRFISLN